MVSAYPRASCSHPECPPICMMKARVEWPLFWRRLGSHCYFLVNPDSRRLSALFLWNNSSHSLTASSLVAPPFYDIVQRSTAPGQPEARRNAQGQAASKIHRWQWKQTNKKKIRNWTEALEAISPNIMAWNYYQGYEKTLINREMYINTTARGD